MASFVVTTPTGAFTTAQYPLKNSAILDSGSTIHIFNQISRFINFRTASPGDFVFAGERRVPIRGYGEVDILLKGPTGDRLMRLYDVAFCENFACNLVSLRVLRKKGYHWDNRKKTTYLKRADGSVVCKLVDRCDQFVLEDIPEDVDRSSFFTRRQQFNTYTKRPPKKGSGERWHLRMGHPGAGALEHLINVSEGVKIKGPTTIECDGCGLSKLKRQVRREPRRPPDAPGIRIAVDFHDLKESANGYTSMMMATDRATGYAWDFYLKDRSVSTLISVFDELVAFLHTRGMRPQTWECDNEITHIKKAVAHHLESKGMAIEPSAPYTQGQNGGAERSGGVIKDKARAMRASSKLPHFLWPEIYKAAIYLYNRTPKLQYDWRTPYDLMHTHISHQAGAPIKERRPQQAHLRVYGCKAYALTTDAKKKSNRLSKMDPRAWIGYLVGYNSTSIYRIWNPLTNEVIQTRDVIFNEDELFDGSIKALADDLLRINNNDYGELLRSINTPAGEPSNHPAGRPLFEGSGTEELDDDAVAGAVDGVYNRTDRGTRLSPEGLGDGGSSNGKEGISYPDTSVTFAPYPSPGATPPAGLLSGCIQSGYPGDRAPNRTTEYKYSQPWQAAFNAGRLRGKVSGSGLTKAQLNRMLKKPRSVHRRSLPALPKSHKELRGHQLEELFREAEKVHLQTHKDMNTWVTIDRDDPISANHQILDCMWVYTYKTDKHGRFEKCKARLVVRGDQQKHAADETYASTLAGRSFRTLMAIAARFDLELLQFDAVNAFVNAPINYNLFMRMPPGYRVSGKILKILRALYGLRESPLLWQRELTKRLKELGFEPVPHEPCIFSKDGVLIFFYVDDIVIAYKKKREQAAQKLIEGIRSRYKLTGGGLLQWFLGIRIIRDRSRRLIWLSQADYFDKIANLVSKKGQKTPTSPITTTELLPNSGLATRQSTQSYQRKVGSLLYAAVITRPDIAFACSRLARFNTNPSEAHHDAADRALLYLYGTREYALQFGGEDKFEMYSDASFADNTIDRKSSQGYAMRLFGGTIGWRANKQDTVTTSTTEAELLALGQAAREAMFVSRLIKEIGVSLDEASITINCDNQQTINLVNKDVEKLRTKLRHVDIHNHWLRQEAQQKRINVRYTPTGEMAADGLTKALDKGKISTFRDQLGLVNLVGIAGSDQLGEIPEELVDVWD